MRLTNLDASFVGQYEHERGSFRYLPSVDGAQGLWFTCPLCQNHKVLCWFRNPTNAPVVPDDITPGPGRWDVSGQTIADVTLSPSVNLDTPLMRETGQCCWHGWVKNGEAA